MLGVTVWFDRDRLRGLCPAALPPRTRKCRSRFSKSAVQQDRGSAVVRFGVADVVERLRRTCREDCNFFAREYVWTEDWQSAESVRRWPDYPYLRNFLGRMTGAAGYERQKLLAAKKSRQLLFTWALCVGLLQQCGFTPHKQAMIQSQKEEKAKALINVRMRFMLRELSRRTPWLMPCTWKLTTQSVVFTFEDGSTSTIWSVPQGPDQVASYSPSIVAVDEAALQEHFRNTYYAALPALRTGGQFVAVSSPRGESFFSRYCQIPAVDVIRAHYKEHPGYVKEAEALGGWDKWKKEKLKEWDVEDELLWEREMEVNEDIVDGLPVFKPPFATDTHVASETIVPNPTIPIIRGWDLGFHHPAAIWMQIAPNGQIVVLDELLGSKQLLVDFIRDVKARSKELDPYPTQDSFRDWCDPEGYKKNRGVGGPSEVELLNEAKIYPLNDGVKIPIKPSLQLLRRNLRLFTDRNGECRPGTLFNPCCKILIRGMNGAYRTADDRSDKIMGGLTKHAMDAFRYAQAGEFGLGKIKVA